MKNTIKKYLILFLLIQNSVSFAQAAFHNFGDIQIHNEGEIGFHTDFINDGDFDNNLGFAGFYNFNGFRTVSGTQQAIFYDLEVDVTDNLLLYTSLGLTNNMLYTTGRVITPRNNISISLDYLNYDVYSGEGDLEHTDGYASITGTNGFIFPIGDDLRLRPMIIPTQANTNYFKGAFFYENPNTPTTFTSSFNTANKEVFLNNISNYEFWDLNGSTETKVTLTWDTESNIPTITTSVDLLRVVGWNENTNKWEDLGRSDTSGDLDSGTVTSNPFTPDNYIVITIGSEFGDEDIEEGANNNYVITPNGDGANDVLVFEGLDQFAKNNLEIYNRWGAIVYETENYENNWDGISTNKHTIYKEEKLPTGTYFYILKIEDTNFNKELTGWVYVNH